MKIYYKNRPIVSISPAKVRMLQKEGKVVFRDGKPLLKKKSYLDSI